MARKTKRTYRQMTLNVTSTKPVTEGKLHGILTVQPPQPPRGSNKTEGLTNCTSPTNSPSGVGGAEFNFDEVSDDKTMLIVGERKWIPIKVNRQYGLRVTKNKETGEYRILCSLTKEKLQQMTLRNVGELEAEFGLMVEKIRL